MLKSSLESLTLKVSKYISKYTKFKLNLLFTSRLLFKYLL